MAPASHVEIRPAVSADAEAIRELTRTAYAKWVALIGREPLPMQADYQRAVAEHTIDLLIDGDALGRPHRDDLATRSPVDRERRGRAGMAGQGLWASVARPGRAARHSVRACGNSPSDQSGLRRQSHALRQAWILGRSHRAVSWRNHGAYEQADRAVTGPRGCSKWGLRGLTARADGSTIEP
jgi:hypothetical protein